MTIRIIPRLDIKGPNLVKGVHLEGLRVLGKPEEFAKLYYEQGADELFYMDVVASLYGRNSLLSLIRRTTEEMFIPFCVGGGIRSLDDIRQVLRAGADKVSLNTAAIKDRDLVRQAAESFGSSTIVLTIEAIQQPDGRYFCFTDSGREPTGLEAIEWAAEAEALGAGELLITSVDRDGTGSGYDLSLMQPIASNAGIPVIAHGGAGDPTHISDVVNLAHADAVCISSLLHYEAILDMKLDETTFSSEGNIEFRRAQRSFSRIRPMQLGHLKQELLDQNVDVRPTNSE